MIVAIRQFGKRYLNVVEVANCGGCVGWPYDCVKNSKKHRHAPLKTP